MYSPILYLVDAFFVVDVRPLIWVFFGRICGQPRPPLAHRRSAQLDAIGVVHQSVRHRSTGICVASSVLPRGERPPGGPCPGVQLMFRSTLPRGERQPDKSMVRQPLHVSIHAPARGAATMRRCGRWSIMCFDPRSRAGSDHAQSVHEVGRGEFRSTLPRGERPTPCQALTSITPFRSTLPRGERPRGLTIKAGTFVFRSTLPRGERRWYYHADISRNQFRSTLPRGERRRALRSIGVARCFDPRSRAGSDLRDILRRGGFSVFRSTLPRGERRPIVPQHTPHLAVSIHAPARGATSARCVILHHHVVSIHAPARGATSAWPTPAIASRFRSTLPRGERPAHHRRPTSGSSFDPRSRAGSDAGAAADWRAYTRFRSTLPRGERPLELERREAS